MPVKERERGISPPWISDVHLRRLKVAFALLVGESSHVPDALLVFRPAREDGEEEEAPVASCIGNP